MVPRLIRRGLVVAGVSAACAAGFVTATSASTASTQACRLASVSSLHGHISMTVHETASGEIPGTTHSEVISLSRQASNVAIDLKKKRLKVRGWIGYYGYSHGGTFAVEDTVAFTGSDTSGTLTANGPPTKVGAVLAAAIVNGSCGYELGVSFRKKATFNGSPGLSYAATVSNAVVTPSRKVPPSGKLAGSAQVPLEWDDCALLESPGGCVAYSGAWSTDFTMLKRCNATSAGKCPSADDTDLGEAQISWNLSPG